MSKLLYTSYFARSAKDPMAFAITVRVPHFAPKMPHFHPLAPTSSLLSMYKNGRINQSDYTDAYLRILNERGKSPQELADLLPSGAVLLCYEGKDNFCHRHIAAEWFRRGGIEVREL